MVNENKRHMQTDKKKTVLIDHTQTHELRWIKHFSF